MLRSADLSSSPIPSSSDGDMLVEVGGMLVELSDLGAVMGYELRFALGVGASVERALFEEVFRLTQRAAARVDSLLESTCCVTVSSQAL